MNTSSFPSSEKNRNNGALFPAGQMISFALVTALFFLWGMSNNLTDILVQQFKKSFELSQLEAQLVQTAVFLGYFCMALPAAAMARRWGYKASILAGLILFGFGTLMFWPAAVIGRYSLMLMALFVIGCGSATLETTANPFIAQTGPSQTSERRLNFSQAFNPLGTITGVLVGAFFIFSGIELSTANVADLKARGDYAGYLHQELLRVVPTYTTIGCIVLLLAVIIACTRFPASSIEDETPADRSNALKEFISLLRTPQVHAAAFTQFFYCGAQVATWSTTIPYLKQYTSLSERSAAYFLTGNLIAFFAGRAVSTALMSRFRPARMMALYALINIVLVLMGAFHPGIYGAGALLATSFFMSVMFPTIFALGVKDLGPRTKLASSLIVMSVVGAALIPPIVGFIAKQTDSYARAYIAIAACYIVVAVYGFRVRARQAPAS